MTTELLEYIEEYLEGKISRTTLEQKAAEQEEDIDLDAEIEWLTNSQIAVEASGLREQIKEIFPKPQQQGARVINFRSRTGIIAVAASVLLLVVGYFGLFYNPEPSLYAQFEYVDPGIPVLMSQTDEYELYDAMSYYSEEDYATAEDKLRALTQTNTQNDTLFYYLGASQLYQSKLKSAIENLDIVSKNTDSEYQEKAEWLKTLAHLKEGNNQEVEQMLRIILEKENHEFALQARDLKNELE